jgi:shikimate kinase
MKKIFLTGVSCVGKTTIGEKLASLLGYDFLDLDAEVERFYQKSIERLQKNHATMDGFRSECAKVLKQFLVREKSSRWVIALPPSGLIHPYWKVIRYSRATIVAIHDEAENILNRIAFFDIDSRPISKILSAEEKQFYLNEIKRDIIYFGSSYTKASLHINIAGLDAEQAAYKIRFELLAKY